MKPKNVSVIPSDTGGFVVQASLAPNSPNVGNIHPVHEFARKADGEYHEDFRKGDCFYRAKCNFAFGSEPPFYTQPVRLFNDDGTPCKPRASDGGNYTTNLATRTF